MHFNQKDQRIRKIWDKGEHDKARIARKIGYGGTNIQEGVRRVEEGLLRLGITKKDYDQTQVLR